MDTKTETQVQNEPVIILPFKTYAHIGRNRYGEVELTMGQYTHAYPKEIGGGVAACGRTVTATWGKWPAYTCDSDGLALGRLWVSWTL